MSYISAASQLLCKHLSNETLEQCLLVDPLEAADFAAQSFASSQVWLFKDIQHSHKNTVSYPEKPPQRANQAIVFFPKAKAKLQWLLDALAGVLENNATIYFVGSNKGGIRSFKNMPIDELSSVQKLASGNHCLLFRGIYQANKQPQSTPFSYHNYLINQHSIKIASLPSVFSHGELDEGTELLLQNLPDKISGNVLDFACGCGVIGSFIKTLHPDVNLTQSDIDCLAIAASQETQKINDIQGKLVLSDGLTNISSKFNWIFTNPPFHTGIKIDYHISEAFIKGCKDVLDTDARLYLVANRFLKYPQILGNHFKQVEVVAEDNKFKVYCAYSSLT